MISMLTTILYSDHSDVCSIFKSRLGVLKEARSVWSVSEPKVRPLACGDHIHTCVHGV